MKHYKIYQLDARNKTTRNMMYMGYDFVSKYFTLSLDLYKQVWEGDTDGDLDDLYTMFNVNHPEGFKGHSLSTSDLVELDGKYFYCDSYGWKEVTFQS